MSQIAPLGSKSPGDIQQEGGKFTVPCERPNGSLINPELVHIEVVSVHIIHTDQENQDIWTILTHVILNHYFVSERGMARETCII